jgi:ubiquinone/menaquinone biosynthesis C-methylase UbiE
LNFYDRQHTQTEDGFIAEDLAQMQLAPNYFNWMFSLIRPYLGKRILEIGSGIGSFTLEFLKIGDFVCGIEPNPSCVNVLKEKFAGEKRLKIISKTLEDCDPQALQSSRFDTLVCCNVLEHIEDDRQAMLGFQRILRGTGGKIILWVPAMPCAYGSIDKAVGHFRRYSKEAIYSLMKDAGIKTFSHRYVNMLGFLGWYVNAHFQKRTKQSDSQIKFFNALVPCFSKIEQIISPPFGMSLLIVADVSKTGENP